MAQKKNKKKQTKKQVSKKTADKTIKNSSAKKTKTSQKKPISKASHKTTKQNKKSIKTANKTKQKTTRKKDSKSVSQTQKKELKSKKLKANLIHREKELQKILEKEKEEKMILKDMQGRTYCQIENCDCSAVVEGYCRIHFFGLYNTIKKKKEILEQDILTKKFSHLVHKHSEEIFEPLFKDLSSDKSFKTALKKISSEDTDDIDI